MKATVWVGALARRFLTLAPGRYLIVLTHDERGADWSITRMGKVEQVAEIERVEARAT